MCICIYLVKINIRPISIFQWRKCKVLELINHYKYERIGQLAKKILRKGRRMFMYVYILAKSEVKTCKQQAPERIRCMYVYIVTFSSWCTRGKTRVTVLSEFGTTHDEICTYKKYYTPRYWLVYIHPLYDAAGIRKI